MICHIAVDVGGTQMRAACYPKDRLEPLAINRIPTQGPNATPEERLQELILSVWPEGETVTAIGVAAPGPLDPYQGVVLAAPNIPGWMNIPLQQILHNRFSVPVAIGNDANLAAMGEWQYGAGQGHHHLIYITVSTGIGSGIIIDDHLLLGEKGLAAEIGHITVEAEGPMCGCGHRGHLEAVAAGPAIARWVQQEIAQGAQSILSGEAIITAKKVSFAAQNGDPLAVEAIGRSGRYIGRAIANLLHLFNPSIVIIGGGVSLSGSFLFDPMWKTIQEDILTPHYLEGFTLTGAALGDDAGLFGALALARSINGSES